MQRFGNKWKRKVKFIYNIIFRFVAKYKLDGKECACNAGDLDSVLVWEDPLKKEMANHSSILAWRIPQTEEPGRLQSMRLQTAGKNWATFTFMYVNKTWVYVSTYSFLHGIWFPYTFASFFSPIPFTPQICFFPLLLFCLKMSSFC